MAVLTVGRSLQSPEMDSPAVHRQDALAWTERWDSRAGQPDEPDDPAALTAERFEQVEHTVVGGAGFARPAPTRPCWRGGSRRPRRRPDRRAPAPAPSRSSTGRRRGGAPDGRRQTTVPGGCPVPQVVSVRRHLGQRPRPLASRCRAGGTTTPGVGRASPGPVGVGGGRTAPARARRARDTTSATGASPRRW